MSECNHDCEHCEENCGNNCNHDCENCSENCAGHAALEIKPLADVKIGKIVGVLSGKGGVGKSMVTSLLAVELARAGYKVGILDADITGPSIPKIFGLKDVLYGDNEGIVPMSSKLGIKTVSINMMLETEDTPVLWRGPILGGVIKQFYTEVHWGELDYLLIDMPPGTADIAISVVQMLPIDSFVMVTTPSKLVSMIVGKTINMAKQVNTPIVGLVENLAFVKCGNCGNEIVLYREDDTEATAKKFDLEVLAKLPMDVDLANLADNGSIEEYSGDYLKKVVEKL